MPLAGPTPSSDSASPWSRWLVWRKPSAPLPGRTAHESGPHLESILGCPDFHIPCDRLIRASGSIVYAWVRQGRALCVGMSGHGLLRPLSASHDVCWAFEPGDFLYVWEMANRQEVRHHERRAIRSVGPEFNLSIADRPQRDGDGGAFVEHGAPVRPAPENLSFPL